MFLLKLQFITNEMNSNFESSIICIKVLLRVYNLGNFLKILDFMIKISHDKVEVKYRLW